MWSLMLADSKDPQRQDNAGRGLVVWIGSAAPPALSARGCQLEGCRLDSAAHLKLLCQLGAVHPDLHDPAHASRTP